MKRLLVALMLLCSLVQVYAGEITGQGITQKDLYEYLNDTTYALNNGTLSDMGVVASGVYIVIGAGGAYMVNGQVYTSTATTTGTFTAGHDALAASEKCIFTVGLNTSGTIVTTQSEIVPSTSDDPSVPRPASIAPIARLEIQTNSTGVFTPNTTSLAAASVTATFADYAHKALSLTIPD